MRHSAGQALIFALLLTAVVITVGLAVVSQSIVDIKTSTQSQETVKAFTAAEAGIERSLAQALVGGSTTLTQVPVGNAVFNAQVTQLGQAQLAYVFPRPMLSGDAQTLWMVSHNANGDLSCIGQPCATLNPANPSFDVYFGNFPTSNPLPALVVDIYYKSNPGSAGYSDIKLTRATFDPDSSRQGTDHFTVVNGSGPYPFSGVNFAYKASVNLSTLGVDPTVYSTANGLQIVRARVFYSTSAQPVAFDFGDSAGRSLSGCATAPCAANTGLPSQGFQPTSVGSVAGSSTIKLTSVYPWPDTFAMFDHAIFAGNGDLCKGGC